VLQKAAAGFDLPLDGPGGFKASKRLDFEVFVGCRYDLLNAASGKLLPM
jgi:hypothetical protein